MFANYTSHLPTILHFFPTLMLQHLTSSQLIAFSLTPIPTVLHSSNLNFCHFPYFKHIYTPHLGQKDKSNLVFSRGDEVPMTGTKSIYSNAQLILMLKKDNPHIYDVVCDYLYCSLLFLSFFLGLTHSTFTEITFVILALFCIVLHHFIFSFVSHLQAFLVHFQVFPSISCVKSIVLNSFRPFYILCITSSPFHGHSRHFRHIPK